MRSVFLSSDVVIAATRPAPGEPGEVAALTDGLLGVAIDTDTRIIVIGGAGPLRSPSDPRVLVVDDPRYVRPEWRASAELSVAQLRACSGRPEADCTYVSPPAMIAPGRRTGRYRRGTTDLLVDRDGNSAIAAEDFAVAVVDELETPGHDRHFTVARLVEPSTGEDIDA